MAEAGVLARRTVLEWSPGPRTGNLSSDPGELNPPVYWTFSIVGLLFCFMKQHLLKIALFKVVYRSLLLVALSTFQISAQGEIPTGSATTTTTATAAR